MKSKKKTERKSGAAVRVQRSVRQRTIAKAIQECADQVPTTWLDGLLTGPDAVLQGSGGTWGCPEIEALCRGIKARILKLSNEQS